MGKLKIINRILLAIFLVIIILFFITVGIGETISLIKYGHDDGIWFGIIPLAIITILIIYLILDFKYYKKGKQETKLIKSAYWINIIVLILSIILAMFIITPCFIGGCDGLGEALALVGLSFIDGVAVLISFIILIIAYIKK